MSFVPRSWIRIYSLESVLSILKGYKHVYLYPGKIKKEVDAALAQRVETHFKSAYKTLRGFVIKLNGDRGMSECRLELLDPEYDDEA